VILARAAATAWRVIDGEAVILSMQTKVLRGLNPVGSRVWELIDGQRPVTEIVDLVTGEFEVPRDRADEDVRTFVQQLLAAGLVTRVA
jgi:hypothetical protein